MDEILDEILFEEDFEISGLVDDRKPVTYFAPWRYICQIRLKGRHNGTGTLIGPKTILTAAHVVWNLDWSKSPVKMVNPVNPSDLGICQGRSGPEWLHSNMVGVESIVFPDQMKQLLASGTTWSPLTNTEHQYLDYAILHLKEPIGNKYGYWTFNHKIWNEDDRPGHSIFSKSGIISNAKVNVAGYPADKGYTASTSTCSECMKTTKGDFPYWDLDKTINIKKDKKGMGRLIDYLGDVMGGMSGGPIFMKRTPDNGGRVLVGVQSTMVAGVKSTGVFINREVQNFIKKNIK